MIRLVGVFFVVLVLYAALMASDPYARSLNTHQVIAGRLGYFGVVTLGVGVLIVAGGVDLSIGSVVGLGAVCFGLMLERGVSPWLAASVTLAGSMAIGLVHGLLVTGLGLQPFLVTLCGLFIYRGVAQWATPNPVGRGEDPAGKAMSELLVGADGMGGRNQLVVLLVVAFVLGLFVHRTRYGRYLFAIGANENATRYAGVPTNRYKILAYVICSATAGVAAILYLLSNSSVDPNSAGGWLELYAITGAVLGGCSLRGGEGMVPGMVLGAAVLPLIRELCSFNKVSNEIEFAVVGFALLLGTIADELLKRRTARRPA
jgi:ribose transport system permease protein